MYNIRYHIASLVGVFLALTIGLLLGTVVAERGTLDDQRDSLINSLERDFADLSDSNARLSAENESLVQFETDIVPVLVAGSLAGKTVGVLTNSGRSDGATAVQEAIKAAGGTPVTIVLEKQSAGLEDPDVTAVVTPLLGGATGDALPGALAARLASEWTTVGPRPVTDALAKAGALSTSELAPGIKIDAYVFTAAWDQKADAVAVEIGQSVAQGGRKAVGAQPVSLDTDVAAAALDKGLDAVDQMGRPVGEYSLVWLLAGRASGYYGTGTGARAAYPAP